MPGPNRWPLRHPRRDRPENYALFRQLISVLVSRNVLMQRRVLACFDSKWPDLNWAVACFQLELIDN
jgi:hypothetical protein